MDDHHLARRPAQVHRPAGQLILSPHALGVLVHPGKGRLAYLNVESTTQMAGTELGEHFSQRGALTRRAAHRGMRPARGTSAAQSVREDADLRPDGES